jgi:hypothetical protein
MQDSGTELNLLYLVVIFFCLSFLFQLMVMVPSGFGYDKIFLGANDDDILYSQSENKPRWCKRILYFNWLRFIEYSISGSLVLFIISMIAGIVDIELLACIFFLSAACMIFGLVAEWFLRMHTVLTKCSFVMGGSNPNDVALKQLFVKLTRRGFWASHIVGWLCILVPWIIIILHYISWFEQCGRATKPPDFVNAVVWAQFLLFTSFGFVQAWQWFYPHKRRMAEILYISLSFAAKGLLGLLLSFTVLAQE